MKHCLVVDDSSVIRKVARRILEGLYLTSTEAENGQEALERCRAAMPDVILLDWHMPVMSGLDFLTALRSEKGGDDPMVFYCTTENDADDISRAIEAGADEYILKPFDREIIEAKFHETGVL